MPETAPGRYEGEFTLDRYGSFLLRAVHKLERTDRRRVDRRALVALPARIPGAAARRGAARAHRRGDRRARLATPAQLFDAQGEKVPYHRELWPWALWLAAFLLLADVAARRVRFI